MKQPTIREELHQIRKVMESGHTHEKNDPLAQPTSDYREVDERFDEEFPGEFITIEDNKARIETRGVTCDNLKLFLHSELDRVREEVVNEAIDVLDSLYEVVNSNRYGCLTDEQVVHNNVLDQARTALTQLN